MPCFRGLHVLIIQEQACVGDNPGPHPEPLVSTGAKELQISTGARLGLKSLLVLLGPQEPEVTSQPQEDQPSRETRGASPQTGAKNGPTLAPRDQRGAGKVLAVIVFSRLSSDCPYSG